MTLVDETQASRHKCLNGPIERKQFINRVGQWHLRNLAPQLPSLFRKHGAFAEGADAIHMLIPNNY
jgi:hypothetical protein